MRALHLVILSAFLALVVLAVACVEAQTTTIDKDWEVIDDTTLSNGTWRFKGRVTVSNGVLSVDNATLLFDYNQNEYALFTVSGSGAIHAKNSVIYGLYSPVALFCWGPVSFSDTVFGETYYSILTSILRQFSGTAYFDGCKFSRWTLDSLSKMDLFECRFYRFDLAIRLGIDTTFDQDRRLSVERCLFSDSIEWGSNDGYGILVKGPALSRFDCNVSIRDCTFSNVKRAISADCFDSQGRLLIDNNTISGSFLAIELVGAGRVCLIGNDTIHASTGISLNGLGGRAPLISNESIIASYMGMWLGLDEVRVHFVLEDMNISSADTGIHGVGANLTLRNSTVRGLQNDLVLEFGLIRLEGCSHTYRGKALDGSILDHRTVSITSVGWDNGEVIDRGRSRFYSWNSQVGRFTDHVVEIDNSDPAPVTFIHWYVNSTLYAVFDMVVPCYISPQLGEDPEYYAPMFSMRDATSLALRYSDVEFQMDLQSPQSGISLGGRLVEMAGNYTERGLGVGTIFARCGAGPLVNGTFDVQGRWSALVPVPEDGMNNLTATGRDLAGNEWTVVARWVYVDGTPPFLEIVGPGNASNQAQTLFVGRTEANASVLVDHRPVRVGREGLFETSLELDEGITIISVFLEDPLGNNRTVRYSIELDTVPPLLVVDLPGQQGWVSSARVNVTGVAEAEAMVRVDGNDVPRDGASFHLVLHLGEGTYQIDVIAVDPAGNQRKETITVCVDLTPPDLIIESPPNGLVQADGEVLVRGVVDDRGPVRLTVAGVEVEVVDGSWECLVELDGGLNDIRVMAIDMAGNTANLTIAVHRDSRPPKVDAVLHLGDRKVTRWSGRSRTGSTQSLLEVHLDEPCIIEVLGIERTARPTEGWSRIISLLANEMNVIVINVTDIAGNHAEEVRFEVICDTRPPHLSVSAPMDGERTQRRAVPVTGRTEPGANLTIDGVPVTLNATGGFRVEVELQHGTNLIDILSRDSVGNEATWTLAVLRLERDGNETGTTTWSLVASLAVNILLLGAVALLLWRARRKVP
jgi:hypothetical protein